MLAPSVAHTLALSGASSAYSVLRTASRARGSERAHETRRTRGSTVLGLAMNNKL